MEQRTAAFDDGSISAFGYSIVLGRVVDSELGFCATGFEILLEITTRVFAAFV